MNEPKSSVKRGLIRIPLRVQITLLLGFFVLSVAGVSFQSSFSFLEEDKMGTIRELQTLKVADVSRDLSDRTQKIRQELREAGIRLLDPERGTPQLDAGVWSWVRVREKQWTSPQMKREVLPADAPLFTSGVSRGGFKAFKHPSEKSHLIVREPLIVGEGGKETTVMIYGEIDRRVLIGDPNRMVAGPIRGVVVDGSELNAKVPRNEREVQDSVWGGVDAASTSFASLLLRLPEIRRTLATPSRPSTRSFLDPTTKSNILVSWATVPIQSADMNMVMVSFVNQTEILRAFFRKKIELAFWVFLVMGFGIMAASFLGSRLSKPIESMVSAAKILEKGDFSVRVTQDRSDELGDLAGAFNHMGEALEQRDRDLAAANFALIQNEKLAALGTLSAGLAHEVKNPLAGILGNADLTAIAIKKMQLGNEGQLLRYVETIQKETKRCKGIIDNLMRFSRNDGAKSVIEFEQMDLEICIWDAIALTEHPLNLAKVKIVKEFSADLWLMLGNANQVEQVLLNMMQNAGHAMPEGGTLTVSTHYFPTPEQVPVGRFQAMAHPDFKGPMIRVTIQDTGTGMTEEVQRKIFEPFFTTKAKGVGTGLGLAVTMQILTEHRARVTLNSAPGEGTAFLIDFPATQPRTSDVLKHLEEVRFHRSGGSTLATDVSFGSPSPERELAQENSLSSAPLSSSTTTLSFDEETTRQKTHLGMKLPRPKLKSEASPPGLTLSTSKFTLRRPVVKKNG